MAQKEREPSLRLDDCEGSTAVVKGGSPDVGNWHRGERVTQPADCLLAAVKLTRPDKRGISPADPKPTLRRRLGSRGALSLQSCTTPETAELAARRRVPGMR
jgi:hypothetical protein